LAEYASMGHMEVFYSFITADAVLNVLSPEVRLRADLRIRKASGRTNMSVLAKMSELVDGNYRIVEDPPLIVHLPEVEERQIDQGRERELEGKLGLATDLSCLGVDDEEAARGRGQENLEGFRSMKDRGEKRLSR